VLRSTAAYAPLAGAVLLMTLPIVRPQGLAWVLERPLWRARRQRDHTDGGAGDRERDALELRPPRRPLRLLLPAHPLLAVEHVTLSFEGLQVLDDVSLEVHRGESVGLIGPNGAGKSTLFNCLSGFLQPRGSIRYHGLELVGRPPELRASLGIGRTFQQVGLCQAQTVWENTLLAQHSLATYGVLPSIVRPAPVRRTEAELAARARAALDLAGIADLAGERVVNLPHGRQRLAEVAAVLAAGPDLLLLDEPAAGMDPGEADELAALLTSLQEQLGFTMVVIDHHVPFVADVCSYVYVLVEGAVVAQGTAAEVQRDPVVAAVYLGATSPSEPVPEVIGV
jgi:branched-chain amino acid transport system ATP-binding protein